MIKNLFFLMLIFLLVVESCTKKFEFTPESQDDFFFLLCALEVGDSPTVRTGKALDFGDLQEFNYICDATIELKANNEVFLLDEKIIQHKICQHTDRDVQIKENTQYDLSIKVEGIEMSSSLIVPIMPNFNATGQDAKFTQEIVTETIHDGKWVKDTFYNYKTIINYEKQSLKGIDHNIGFGVAVLDSTLDCYFFVDILCEPIIPSRLPSIRELCINKEPQENFEVELEFGVTEQLDAIDIITKLYVIDEELMKYNVGIGVQSRYLNDPFTVPSLPYTNIEGGTGVFGSFKVIRDTMSIKLIN